MAHDTTPIFDDGSPDDEIGITRELLDDPSPTHPHGWRNVSARIMNPVGGHRALTPRQKALRGSVTAMLFILTLYLLLGGPATTAATLNAWGVSLQGWLHPAPRQPTLAERQFFNVHSPPGANNLQTMTIAPVSGKAGAAWTCWTSPPGANQLSGGWLAHGFYTSDDGHNWKRLRIPEASGQSCAIDADSARPSALYMFGQNPAPDGSCTAPTAMFTRDGGDTWVRVPWPVGPSDAACQFGSALIDGVIYLWSASPLTRWYDPYVPPTGRILMSLNAGQSWTPADIGLEDANGFTIVGVRPHGHILATLPDVHSDGSSSLLMASDDYGASWSNLGRIPNAFPEVYVSTDPNATDHGGWGRIYALGQQEVNGSITVPLQPALETTLIGQPWRPIPLPPMPAGADQSPQSREPIVLGIGPSASLELERGVVQEPQAQLSPARRFWLWIPKLGRWSLDPLALPGNLEIQGDAWNNGAQTLWVTILRLGVPPVLQIYTKTLPPDPSSGAT